MTIKFSEIKSNFKRYIKLYRVLLTDKRTPTISRILLSAAIGYLFMPFDLIPDFIPVIGHIDDVLIVPGLIYLALKFIPKEVYQEHKNEIFKNSKD